jgi:hypothetical protein
LRCAEFSCSPEGGREGGRRLSAWKGCVAVARGRSTYQTVERTVAGRAGDGPGLLHDLTHLVGG